MDLEQPFSASDPFPALILVQFFILQLYSEVSFPSLTLAALVAAPSQRWSGLFSYRYSFSAHLRNLLNLLYSFVHFYSVTHMDVLDLFTMCSVGIRELILVIFIGIKKPCIPCGKATNAMTNSSHEMTKPSEFLASQ